MTSVKYDNPISATWHGIMQVFGKQERIGELRENERLDGKTCIVTGANSGLGFAIAKLMAERGGHIIMACRSDIPGAGERIKGLTGSEKVEMMMIDLTSFASIDRFVEELRSRNIYVDIFVSNAGVVKKKSNKTEDGFDEMFQVNYLSKFYLINSLLNTGIIMNSAIAGNYDASRPIPRIIFVSSESHRSPESIDFENLGHYKEYHINKTMSLYAYYKLLLTIYVNELSRRLNPGNNVEVPVHAVCPGPVNTNIAREAPSIFKPLIKLIFMIYFREPEDAAEPVLYLTCSSEMGRKSARYLHVMKPKPMDAKATDAANGEKLWNASWMLVSR